MKRKKILMIIFLFILNSFAFCGKINFYKGETLESIIEKIDKPTNIKWKEDYFVAQYKNYGIDILFRKDLGLREIWVNSDRVYPYELGIIVGDSMQYVFKKCGAPIKEITCCYEDASSCKYGSDRVLYKVVNENGLTRSYKYVCNKTAFWFNLDKKVTQIAWAEEIMRLYLPKQYLPEYSQEIQNHPIVIHGWVENFPERTSLTKGSPYYFYIISLSGERYGVYYFKENCIIEDIFNHNPQIVKGRRISIRGIFKKYEEIYPGFSKLNPVIKITNSIEARVITLW